MLPHTCSWNWATINPPRDQHGQRFGLLCVIAPVESVRLVLFTFCSAGFKSVIDLSVPLRMSQFQSYIFEAFWSLFLRGVVFFARAEWENALLSQVLFYNLRLVVSYCINVGWACQFIVYSPLNKAFTVRLVWLCVWQWPFRYSCLTVVQWCCVPLCWDK